MTNDRLSQQLVLAVATNDLAEVSQALAAGASPNSCDRAGKTALSLALEAGKQEIANLLLAAGAEDERAETSPAIAGAIPADWSLNELMSQSFDLFAVDDSELGLVASIDTDARTEISAATPLVAAVLSRDIVAVKALIAQGVDLDAVERASEGTALSAAIANNFYAAAEMLLDAGADPNLGDSSSIPLSIAATNGNEELFRLLLEAGADPNRGTTDDASVMLDASACGRLAIVKLLVENGADVNDRRQGETAMTIAARNGYQDIYDYLSPLVNARTLADTAEVGIDFINIDEAETLTDVDAKIGELELRSGIEPIDDIEPFSDREAELSTGLELFDNIDIFADVARLDEVELFAGIEPNDEIATIAAADRASEEELVTSIAPIDDIEPFSDKEVELSIGLELFDNIDFFADVARLDEVELSAGIEPIDDIEPLICDDELDEAELPTVIESIDEAETLADAERASDEELSMGIESIDDDKPLVCADDIDASELPTLIEFSYDTETLDDIDSAEPTLCERVDDRELLAKLESIDDVEMLANPDRVGAADLLPALELIDGERSADIDLFIAAAMSGNLEEMRAAIADGIDVNAIGADGQTALMSAANYGQIAIVEALLDAGADPNLASDGESIAGKTALMYASGSFFASNREVIAKLLIDRGAKLDLQDGNGRTALMYGLNYSAVVKVLVEARANLNLLDRERNTALMLATTAKCQAAIDLLTLAGASPVGLRAIRLIQAVETEDLAKVNKFIAAGANYNHAEGRALICAASNGNIEIVQALIDAGADVNLGANSGFTPLASAAYAGLDEIVRVLLAAGADPSLKTFGGEAEDALGCARLGQAQAHYPNARYAEVIALLTQVDS